MGIIAPTIRLRRLGLALKHEREAAGLTLDEAAALLARHATSIGRIEKGLHHARVRDVEYMLTKYGVTDPAVHERLYDWSRNGRKKGWWQDFRADLSREAMDLIGLEADADSIEHFELIVVPGLLQTEDYMRAVIEQGQYGREPDHVERLIAIRLQRQAILARSNPPEFWAIIDEAVLHRQVGSRAIMKTQLRRLLEFSRLPHVTLQVLTFRAGAYPGMSGAFINLEIRGPGSLRVVAVDSLTQMSYREEEEEIRTYANAFDRLRATALPEADSRALIEGLLSKT